MSKLQLQAYEAPGRYVGSGSAIDRYWYSSIHHIISSWLFGICVFRLWLNIGVPGDLHDGAGLTDVTDPNGLVANPIFENVPYDLLTIGAIFSHSNHTKILI